MARYKRVDYAQGQFISISFEHQILPGTFEYALSHVVDNKLDFTTFDAAHKNDDGGAPIYDPRVIRMGIVEPVFPNLRHMLGFDRFTLRGSAKVNIQWKLFAVIHNLLKIHRYGWAGAG